MEKQHKYLKCVKFLIQPKEIKKYLWKRFNFDNKKVCVYVGGFKVVQLGTKEKQHMKCGSMWIWPTSNNHQ
jgi:hypothetical protein